MKVLVVGATGFVGQGIFRYVTGRPELFSGIELLGTTRAKGDFGPHLISATLDELSLSSTLWDGVDGLVYLSGVAHNKGKGDVDQYDEVNHRQMLNVVRAARDHGVKRIVYISSIGVLGRYQERGSPAWNEDSPYRPYNAYSFSKMNAELGLMLHEFSNLDITILRPPLIYGEGAPANFGALVKLVGSGLPLPFLGVRNRRSFIGIENLAHIILTVLNQPNHCSGVRIYNVSDTQDISTEDLVGQLQLEQSGKKRLFWLPAPVVRKGATLLRRGELYHQLWGNLQIDPTKLHRDFQWHAPHSWQSQLANTVVLPSKPAVVGAGHQVEAYLAFKMNVDRVLAALGLVFLLPLLLAVALAIYLDDPGPVIYRQTRAGRHHRPFTIYKFRSMLLSTPSLSTAELQARGIRTITRVGGFIRKTSLDELPQLINVLKGEMSLIGPRPALMTQTVILQGREQLGIQVLRPGMSGLAQIRGRDDLSDGEKIAFDQHYLQNIGFFYDLKLILETFKAVVSARGNK